MKILVKNRTLGNQKSSPKIASKSPHEQGRIRKYVMLNKQNKKRSCFLRKEGYQDYGSKLFITV